MARIDDIKDLAERILGWTIIERHDDGLKMRPAGETRALWWTAEDEDPDDDLENTWDPFEDANDVLGIAQALRAKGWLPTVDWSTDGKYACFLAPVVIGEQEPPHDNTPPAYTHFHGSTFCEAICAAALAVIRSEPTLRNLCGGSDEND